MLVFKLTGLARWSVRHRASFDIYCDHDWSHGSRVDCSFGFACTRRIDLEISLFQPLDPSRIKIMQECVEFLEQARLLR